MLGCSTPAKVHGPAPFRDKCVMKPVAILQRWMGVRPMLEPMLPSSHASCSTDESPLYPQVHGCSGGARARGGCWSRGGHCDRHPAGLARARLLSSQASPSSSGTRWAKASLWRSMVAIAEAMLVLLSEPPWAGCRWGAWDESGCFFPVGYGGWLTCLVSCCGSLVTALSRDDRLTRPRTGSCPWSMPRRQPCLQSLASWVLS